MEMKWNPIIDGDLSEVPVFEDVLFTIIDEATGEDYVIYDELNPTYLKDGFVVFIKLGLSQGRKKLQRGASFQSRSSRVDVTCASTGKSGLTISATVGVSAS